MTKIQKLIKSYSLLAEAFDEMLDSEYNLHLSDYKNAKVVESLKLFKEVTNV